ncbi:HAD-IC family P-type ATPase, partial [Bordetella pertussis]|uniref:HAD-IC family P-type ATPase n=1 Tax=Bordetella pertussis TaxID=520 RepID=UPI0021CBE675
SRGWRLLAAGGVLAALSELAHFTGQPVYVAAALALAAILACGLSTYRKGWIAVRNGNLNINALMSIAVTGAMLIGQWPEAAMVMFLFNVIAADGTISEGQSAIDQSPITGESLPVEKGPDDDVYAGTVNASGSFDYRVTAAAGNTTLDRIIHAVEQAQGARAPTQRFIDRFSRIYTPAVVGLAVLVALAPPLLLGHAWLDSVYRALALLIIACPCALVISTPVSVVSGLTAAARRGILIKGGVYLEEGRKLRWLALDKTGTL